ncbi:ankyrin repeat domain-containing protein [Hydrogenophaga sp.]|uniref:ankyrin repeat domain-containing protein n=1 Tax=Hydrogenophaga sp. TaxID=1904254 RepID=UPI00272F7527|nr:ankyrin repeat domain-containing protein [Hydrogenophaga sp.]MDP2073872.1 ankyrin repeat domain-containing protein [Hydrogenophaga sp.]MDP2987962.1 ankyrin repeat domain-containing protein [Hydrogenophaga sp.]MDP3107330.1 ankyrin repeat domain-containing protein [Hydrogenophaga sp.]MDP3349913.1 ankyrin repeat domain-containing protein [Hydrogenophaga sp.]MDZ4281756.1 ankyrin repeat domain-containing protein [Hydrogenophaga sp.]
MTDWKTQQMIKASGWPLAPELLAPGADFSAPAEGGLVPWHWACSEGKAGLVRYMLDHGADPQDRTPAGQAMLHMAARAKSFQVVMLLIDALKASGAPVPEEGLRSFLTKTFAKGHPDSKNRLQQTLKDWDRLQRQATPGKPA